MVSFVHSSCNHALNLERNAPYILGARAVAYAIAAGNTTVLKASELSPRCFWAIGKAFQEAGLPAGVLNILAYKPEDAPVITTALIEHPAVKKINFTGSTAVGSIIASTCGKALKPCLMELGGKNTSMVLQDADLEKAAAGCAMGAFLHVRYLHLAPCTHRYRKLIVVATVRSNMHVNRHNNPARLHRQRLQAPPFSIPKHHIPNLLTSTHPRNTRRCRQEQETPFQRTLLRCLRNPR